MSSLRKIPTRNDAPQLKSRSLDSNTLLLVQSSLPTFRENSKQIAIEMYRRIFHLHPSLKSLFSLEFLDARSKSSNCPLAHHGVESQISAQAQILADSILNFCANVNDMQAFEPVLVRICAKHVSRQVQPDHYTVVAKCFSEAVSHVIGDKVSSEEQAAWDRAVLFLANILINREKQIYKSLETTPGAWKGFREFQVSKMEEIRGMSGVSVALRPKDKGSLAEYMSGQYVCMRIETEGLGTVHRNIALCPRMMNETPENDDTLANYTVKLAVPTKQMSENDCRISSDLLVYQHIQKGGDVDISAPVGGYVQQQAAGGRIRAARGTYLRASAMGKSNGLGVSPLAAVQGTRSPLAEVVSNDLSEGFSQLRMKQLKGTAVKKPSPMSRFADLNGGF